MMINICIDKHNAQYNKQTFVQNIDLNQDAGASKINPQYSLFL